MPDHWPTEISVSRTAPVASSPQIGWAGIARFGGIGDNLMAAAACPGLKKKYGRVEVISSDPQAIVFRNNPHIDKLSVVDQTLIPKDTPENNHRWFEARASEYAFFAHLSHSCETLRALFPQQTQFWWPAAARAQNVRLQLSRASARRLLSAIRIRAALLRDRRRKASRRGHQAQGRRQGHRLGDLRHAARQVPPLRATNHCTACA